MDAEIMFRGGGGGDTSDGSEGTNFVQKPDTLRSNDTFEGLLGLCIGPIKGPVSGMKSIRVNDTPIEDATGNLNFQDFTAVFADGDPLKFPQKIKLRLGSAGAPLSINTQLRNVGGNAPVWVTRTVNNLSADAIDLRFIVSALYQQSEDGIFEATADIEIQMKPTGTTTWINPFKSNATIASTPPGDDGYPVSSGTGGGSVRVYYSEDNYYSNRRILDGGQLSAGTAYTITPYLTITGKTTSPYIKEARITVPSTGAYANKSWDIRCRLVETEDLSADPDFEKRTITWESATAVYFDVLGTQEDWRGVGWLQIYGKAGDAFNGVPEVTGIYDTKIVQVPPAAVYNPTARTYSGTIWDGSWAKAYTNDPAWCINDVISDSLAGIARLVPGAHLNKWDALELSKYCSAQVSDGAGGTHCRFSMNLAINEAQRSDDFVRWMAGACGATAWDAGEGEWRCVVDKPQTPVALFTYENIENEFQYSHTDIDTRFNDVTVVFLNEEFDYREDRVRIEDPDHIAKYGRKPTKVVAIGCTHRQQAVRWAILKMRTCVNEFRTVSFTTNRQGKYLERFNWILLADQTLNMTADDLKRTSGRIVENKGGSVVLRDTIRLEAGVAYNLRVTVPNPDYNPDVTSAPTDLDWNLPTVVITRTVMNGADQRGDVKEIFIDSPLPANVAENANIALEAPNLPSVPKVFRVIDLKHADDGERVIVSAIEVDTGKYVASDTGVYDPSQPGYPGGGSGGGGVVPKPTAPDGGVFTLTSFVSAFTGVTRHLIANWDKPEMSDFKAFRLRWRFNMGAWKNLPDQSEDFWELPNEPTQGRYQIEIRCVANSGKVSLPLTGTIAVPSAARSVYVSYGTPVIYANYDSTGAAPQDLPKTELYKLSSNGLELNDAVWQYRVVDGGVNGFNTKSGWQPMMSTGGVGSFELSSVEVDNSKIEIKGSASRKSASQVVVIDKVLGSAPPPSGTSGYASQTSGFTAIPTPGTSYVPITNEITINMPSGDTSLKANIALSPRMGAGASNNGPWDIQYKLQRKINGVWTDVGAVLSSNPDPYLDVVDTGGTDSTGGGPAGGKIP